MTDKQLQTKKRKFNNSFKFSIVALQAIENKLLTEFALEVYGEPSIKQLISSIQSVRQNAFGIIQQFEAAAMAEPNTEEPPV